MAYHRFINWKFYLWTKKRVSMLRNQRIGATVCWWAPQSHGHRQAVLFVLPLGSSSLALDTSFASFFPFSPWLAIDSTAFFLAVHSNLKKLLRQRIFCDHYRNTDDGELEPGLSFRFSFLDILEPLFYHIFKTRVEFSSIPFLYTFFNTWGGHS